MKKPLPRACDTVRRASRSALANWVSTPRRHGPAARQVRSAKASCRDSLPTDAANFCQSAFSPTPIISLRMTRGKSRDGLANGDGMCQAAARRGRCVRVPRRHRDRAECGDLFNLYLPGPRQLRCCETCAVHRRPGDTVSIDRGHGIIGHEVGRPRPWFPFTTGYLSRRSPRTSCGLARRGGVQRSGYGNCAVQVSAAHNLGRWLPGAGTRVRDLPPAGPRSASSRGLGFSLGAWSGILAGDAQKI